MRAPAASIIFRAFVAGEVIEDDTIAKLQGRDENCTG